MNYKIRFKYSFDDSINPTALARCSTCNQNAAARSKTAAATSRHPFANIAIDHEPAAVEHLWWRKMYEKHISGRAVLRPCSTPQWACYRSLNRRSDRRRTQPWQRVIPHARAENLRIRIVTRSRWALFRNVLGCEMPNNRAIQAACLGERHPVLCLSARNAPRDLYWIASLVP